MRIKNANEYITGYLTVPDEKVALAVECGAVCRTMKICTRGGDCVMLCGLEEGCYWGFVRGGRRLRKALKACWAVEYMLNDAYDVALFDDEAEAIDFTLKLIALIKA